MLWFKILTNQTKADHNSDHIFTFAAIMATLRIYLNKEQANKKGLSIIYFLVEHKGKRIKVSSKIKTTEGKWDDGAKRIKTKNNPDAYEDNAKLDLFQKGIESIFREMVDDFNFEIAKKRIDAIFNPTDKPKDKDFIGYFEELITISKGLRAKNTIKNFNQTKNLLKEFQEKKSWPLTFAGMDRDFFNTFMAYMQGKGLLNNTTAKHFACLRTFLRWVEENKGYNVNPDFLKFKGKEHDIEAIFLTEKELMHFYHLPLEGKLERIRDLFCLACFTGLRFSDIMQLGEDSVKNDAIHLTMVKTKESLVVPLNKYSRAIFEKYQNKLPKLSNQKANAALKEAAKAAELNSIEKMVQFRGAERIETKAPKHELLSFHDSRNTFIIYMLLKQTPHRVIMQITGHKDLKSFERYIRIANDVTVDAMRKAWG